MVVQSGNIVLSGGRVCFAMCHNGRVFFAMVVLLIVLSMFLPSALTHTQYSGGCGSPKELPHVSISDFSIRRRGRGGGQSSNQSLACAC